MSPSNDDLFFGSGAGVGRAKVMDTVGRSLDNDAKTVVSLYSKDRQNLFLFINGFEYTLDTR